MSRTKVLGVVVRVMALAAMLGCESASDSPEHTFPSRDFACASGAGQTGACEADVPLLDERERTVPLPRTMSDVTRAYVVDLITIPAAVSAGGVSRAAGFNVDGLDTRAADGEAADCTHRSRDFASLSEDGLTGVDNALEAFLRPVEMLLSDCPGDRTEGCLDATLLEQINAGALVLLVEVRGIDDYVYDDSVSVQILLGELESGGPTPDLEGGRLRAGQRYVPAVGPTGAPLLLGPAYAGDIFAGRLRIQTDSLLLSVNTGERQLDLTLASAELRFDIDGDRLSAGMIGGALPVEDLVGVAAMVSSDLASLVRVIAEGAADVGPAASDPGTCRSVSMGIAFEATSAVLTR